MSNSSTTVTGRTFTPSIGTAKSEQRTEHRQKGKQLQPLTCRVVTTENDFLALRSEWNTLVDHSPVHVYQTFDWQWYWWKHYGGTNKLHILTYRSGQRLVGIIPMFVQRWTLFGKTVFSRQRMIGSGVDSQQNIGLPSEYGVSDYLDGIVLPGFAHPVAEMLAHSLHSNSALVDEVQFSNVPEGGFLHHYGIKSFADAGLRWTIRKSDPCPYVNLPATHEDFFKHLRPSTRYRLRHAKKEFYRNPPFSIESVAHRATLRQSVNDLIRLHQIRWNRLGYAGLFSDTRFRAFVQDVLQPLYEQGILWFKAVRMGGIHPAIRLGFLFKGRMYDYLSGFDDLFPGAKKRPSLALLNVMIEDAIDNNAGTVDFLRGNEPYKYELTDSNTHNVEVQIYNNRPGLSVRRNIYRLYRFYTMVYRFLAGEWKLLGIQRTIHGNAEFLFSYFEFLLKRAEAKIFPHAIHGER